MTGHRRVVVVGAGLGGLAAACHLAGSGHQVSVFEAGAGPGGRAGTWSAGGYRFETGPTVLTMPHLIERCFDAVGLAMDEHLRLRPVDPMYRACFADGSEIRVRHGQQAMEEEIRTTCGEREAEAFGRFVRWLTELYEVEMPNFIERDFDSPLELLRPLGPAIRLLELRGFDRLDRVVGRFFDDERLRRLFTFQSLYAGLAPYQALAIYAVIAYMDTVNGVVVPEGGMTALPRALADAATGAGVEVHYDTPVQRVVLLDRTSGPVEGVRLRGGELVAADAVVVNADLPNAYRTLMPDVRPPRSLQRARFAPSAVVWHVGARGPLPEGVAHHNIHFGGSWEGSFRSLLERGVRMPDPSRLVSVPSLDEPSMAPSGGHSLYVLEPVPNLDGHVDWLDERARVRDDLAVALDRLGYPSDVEVERMVDPLDWNAQGLARGTPFALAHTFLQSGPFRPTNVERRAPGLVFAGSSTVPGVGVPMVLISGELAARRVAAQEGSR